MVNGTSNISDDFPGTFLGKKPSAGQDSGGPTKSVIDQDMNFQSKPSGTQVESANLGQYSIGNGCHATVSKGAASVAGEQPFAASASPTLTPPNKKQKGRPKKRPEMDEKSLKEFYRRRNAVYSRRKYMRKKIEIQVLQDQELKKRNENHRLIGVGAHLEKLLQDAKQIVALHEAQNLHGVEPPLSVIGLASSLNGSSSCVGRRLCPASMPILSSFAAAEQLRSTLLLMPSVGKTASNFARLPSASASASLASTLRLQQLQQQHLFAESGLLPSATLEQILRNHRIAREQSRGASFFSSVTTEDHRAGLRQTQHDLYQNTQVQIHLEAQRLGLNMGRYQMQESFPAWWTLAKNVQISFSHSGKQSDLHRFLQQHELPGGKQSIANPGLPSTEAINSLIHPGAIGRNVASALLKHASDKSSRHRKTAVSSTNFSYPPGVSSADIDSAAALLQLLQQQQHSAASTESPLLSSSSSSSLTVLVELLRRQNNI